MQQEPKLKPGQYVRASSLTKDQIETLEHWLDKEVPCNRPCYTKTGTCIGIASDAASWSRVNPGADSPGGYWGDKWFKVEVQAEDVFPSEDNNTITEETLEAVATEVETVCEYLKAIDQYQAAESLSKVALFLRTGEWDNGT